MGKENIDNSIIWHESDILNCYFPTTVIIAKLSQRCYIHTCNYSASLYSYLHCHSIVIFIPALSVHCHIHTCIAIASLYSYLHCQCCFADGKLCRVCSVQTVDAVGSNNSMLSQTRYNISASATSVTTVWLQRDRSCKAPKSTESDQVDILMLIQFNWAAA